MVPPYIQGVSTVSVARSISVDVSVIGSDGKLVNTSVHDVKNNVCYLSGQTLDWCLCLGGCCGSEPMSIGEVEVSAETDLDFEKRWFRSTGTWSEHGSRRETREYIR